MIISDGGHIINIYHWYMQKVQQQQQKQIIKTNSPRGNSGNSPLSAGDISSDLSERAPGIAAALDAAPNFTKH